MSKKHSIKSDKNHSTLYFQRFLQLVENFWIAKIFRRRFWVRPKAGVVLILFLASIPVILLGTKWVLDQRTAHEVESSVVQSSVINATGKLYKRCAKDVVLAVAKNWNPGLTLGQQKEGIYKVADAVYNAAPSYSSAAVKYEAIPGLEVPTQTAVTKGNKFNPLRVFFSSSTSLSPSMKTVGYTAQTIYNCRWTVCRFVARD